MKPVIRLEMPSESPNIRSIQSAITLRLIRVTHHVIVRLFPAVQAVDDAGFART
jgi:hypothetical protein